MKKLSDCHTLPNVTYALCPVLVSEAPYRYPVSMSVRSGVVERSTPGHVTVKTDENRMLNGQETHMDAKRGGS